MKSTWMIRTGPAVVVMFINTIASAQTVSGTVSEKSSGAVVPGTGIIMLDVTDKLRTATITDSVGHYQITAPPGDYKLRVSRLGLSTVTTESFSLNTGNDVVKDVVLALQPTTLAAVKVSGKRIVDASAANPDKYKLFLMRRELGIGHFITREQIEAKPVSQTPSIFAQIPGLKVRQHGTTWDIRSQRCAPKLDKPGPEGNEMEDDDPEVWPILFIDGFHVQGLARLNDIQPSQIEGIEVYQGASELPAEAKGNACAAIFIWLKSGQ
jgi:hypothetical protein